MYECNKSTKNEKKYAQYAKQILIGKKKPINFSDVKGILEL